MRRLKITEELERKRNDAQHLYKNEESVEYTHGGKREGSGRKVIGETHKVSISLPHGDWERFDELRGEQSRSAFLRYLILREFKKGGNDGSIRQDSKR